MGDILATLFFCDQACHIITHTRRHLDCMWTTENEVLSFMAVKSCIWMPQGLLDLQQAVFVALSCIDDYSPKTAVTGTHSLMLLSCKWTIIQSNCFVSKTAQVCVVLAALIYLCYSHRCLNSHVLYLSNNCCKNHVGLSTPLLYGTCSFKSALSSFIQLGLFSNHSALLFQLGENEHTWLVNRMLYFSTYYLL